MNTRIEKARIQKKTRRSGSSGYDFAIACLGSEELLLGFFGRSSSGIGSRSGSHVGGRGHRVSRVGRSSRGVGRSGGGIASGSGGVAGSGGGVCSGVASSGSGVGGGIGGFGGSLGSRVSGFFSLVASRQCEDRDGEQSEKILVHGE